MTILEKVQELFGENITIKSKKVKELINEEMTGYTEGKVEDYFKEIHFFHMNKTYKVGKAEFPLYLKATQMKNGTWWIQQG